MNFQDFVDLGISVMPLTKKLLPAKEWSIYKERLPTPQECHDWEQQGFYIGIIAGDISGGLHCIDYDYKNAQTGRKLVDDHKAVLDEYDSSIMPSMVWQKTRSGGFHGIYRTTATTKNEKYASRLSEGIVRTMVESRGTGGMFIYYGAIKGAFDNIPTLTEEQHELVRNTAISLNEYAPVNKREAGALGYNPEVTLSFGEVSPKDDYIEQTDETVLLDMLMEHGWTIAREHSDYWDLRRPGKHGDGISATLGRVPGCLYVFSSSTVFPELIPRNAFQVLMELEFDGDYGATMDYLREEGYGVTMSDVEKRELIDSMIGKKDVEVTKEQEDSILSCITTPEQDMQEQIDFVAKGRFFKLSDRFKDLMPMMEPVAAGDLAAFVAPSSTGKTSVVRQVINDALTQMDEYGIYVSLEMNKRSLALRNAMEMSDPDSENYVNPVEVAKRLYHNEEFRKQVVSEYSNLYTMSYKYDAVVIREIIKMKKKQMANEGKRLTTVIFDFFGLLDGGNEVDKQSKLAQTLKQMADVDDMLIIPLLQSNKNADTMSEPNLNDISGHGAIKQALDYAFFLQKHPAFPDSRIICTSAKERHTRMSKCDLVQDGMRIRSEPHIPIDKAMIKKMNMQEGI